jgi:hypothetical protein
MAVQNADGHAPSNPGGPRRDDFEDFPRGRGGRPKIIRAEWNEQVRQWLVPRDIHGKPVLELVEMTRASTLGGALERQTGLERWKAAVAMWGVVRSRTLAKRVRAVDGYSRPDQKTELYEVLDKAKAYAESDSAANHGTALHSLFQRIAEGETVEELVERGATDEEDVPALVAFADALSRWDVLYCERRVVCDEAQAAGKYDLIVTARRPMPVTDKAGRVIDVILPGERIVVDNKTSGSADYFGEKFTVQLWVYAHGRDYNKETGERTEVGCSKRWALILHVPSGTGLDEEGKPSAEGGIAEWHWVDLSIGEKLVRDARDVLEDRKLGKAAIVKADLDAEIPPELLQARFREVASGIDVTVPLHVAADADQALHEQLQEDAARDAELDAELAEELAPQAGPLADAYDAELAGREVADPPYITEEEYQASLVPIDPGGPHKGDDYDAERHAPGCNGDHPVMSGMTCPDPYLPTVTAGVAVAGPAPSTTAIVNAELVATSNGTTAVPVRADLAGHLQRSAAVSELLHRITQAPTLLVLLDLFNKATEHGYMSDEVKAACTARKLQLQEQARTSA